MVVLTVPWLPEEASTQAGPIDTLYDVLAVISVFIFALVMAILIVSVMPLPAPLRRPERRRADPRQHRPRGRLDRDPGRPDDRRRRLQRRSCSRDIEEPKAGTQTIDVTGQQFAWTFDYAGEGVKRAGELHLVKGTPYLFKIHAKDVLHSFWVPEFRMKKDAVPGMTTNVRVTPDRIGTLRASSAPSSAGSATRRCARRSWSRTRPSFDRWAAAAEA